MTDNEIIKALEEHSKDRWFYLLHDCSWEAVTHFLDAALDLINRQKAEIAEQTLKINQAKEDWKSLSAIIEAQKAEIERLRKSNEEMFITISEQDAKFKKWREECENQSVLWSKHFESIFETAKETVKAEAIKEFAERLKTNDFFANFTYKGEAQLIIDNLVKEMVGDTE